MSYNTETNKIFFKIQYNLNNEHLLLKDKIILILLVLDH